MDSQKIRSRPSMRKTYNVSNPLVAERMKENDVLIVETRKYLLRQKNIFD